MDSFLLRSCLYLCVCVAFRGILNNPTKAVRDTLVNQCAQILACYRKNCASPSSAGQVLKTTHATSCSIMGNTSYNTKNRLQWSRCVYIYLLSWSKCLQWRLMLMLMLGSIDVILKTMPTVVSLSYLQLMLKLMQVVFTNILQTKASTCLMCVCSSC